VGPAFRIVTVSIVKVLVCPGVLIVRHCVFLKVMEAALHASVVEVAANPFQLLVARACLMLVAVGVMAYFRVSFVSGFCLCSVDLRWVPPCLMLDSYVCYAVILNAFVP
jgi:hypothetical protein